jgi:hypothetical protein
MSAIRKFGWTALVLAGFAGCAKDEPMPATPAPAETKAEATDAKPAAGAEGTPSGEMKSDVMKGPSAAPAGEMPKIEAPQPTPAPKEEGKGAAVSLKPNQLAAIKLLPAGEAEQALKQVVCPVSGGNLGAMGMPYKITANGQTFFLCCDGCEEDVKADPAAVVAKLKK